MKKGLFFLSLLLSYSILTPAQTYVTSRRSTPNIVGLPGISAMRVDNGWTLRNVMLFDADKRRKLQLIIGPSRTSLLPAQQEKLVTLSLKANEEIPEEFYVVPNDRAVLYHCLHSIPRHTVFCKRVIISPKPSLLGRENNWGVVYDRITP